MSRKTWSSEKLLGRVLQSRSERAYQANLQELRSRADPALFHAGILLTASGIRHERIIGINLLSQLGGSERPYRKRVLKHYVQLLQSEADAEMQQSVLYGIGHNNSGLTLAQTKLLAPFGRSLNPDVRRATVHALLGVANSIAIKALIGLSCDAVAAIRNWATFGLGEQIDADTAEIRAALFDRLADRHRDTRAEAIRGLAKRGDQRVAPVIMEALRTEDFGALLFDSIMAIDDKDVLPVLKRLYRKYRTDDSIDPHWLGRLADCIAYLSDDPQERTGR